ncbi:MAG: alpha/beta hydrolase, partial [Candidatus Kariarchaeaceae archaeon]
EPERIQSLFLLAPSARFNLPVWSGIALSLSRVAHLRFIDSFLEGLVTVIAKVIGEGELVGLGIERFNHIDIEFHHKIVKETLKEWDRLNASLELPVFIMSGTKDWIVPHKDSLQLAENLPNSSIIAIEGGDHHLIRLRPDLVLDLVEQWLDDMHSMTKEKQYNDEDLRLIDGKYVLQKGQETILPPVEMAS